MKDQSKQKDVITNEHNLGLMGNKRACKNCGDEIGDESNSSEFCSDQCGVEYRMEHDRK
jgi:predicted RNA-binding Zn-ribbon protein involved in translation (DUF1610 family)